MAKHDHLRVSHVLLDGVRKRRLLLPRPHFSARPNRSGSRGSRSEITERDWENINALHA